MSDVASRLEALGHAVRRMEADEAAAGALENGEADLVFDDRTDRALDERCAAAGVRKVSWLTGRIQPAHPIAAPANAQGVTVLTPFAGLIPVFEKAGYETALHFPPGANLDRMKFVEHKETDVVFIGDSLADEKYEYPQFLKMMERLMEGVSENGQAALNEFLMKLETVIWEQSKTPGHFVAERLVDGDEFIKTFPVYQEMDPAAFPYMLGVETTSRMRVAVLETLSDMAMEIYGPESWGMFPALATLYKGQAPYEQANGALGRGRITVNVSRVFSPAIGRMLSAAAVGTMLITEQRAGDETLLEPGGETVTYASLEEIREKTGHYLENSSERERIARAARNRVEKDYDMDKLLPRAIDIAMSA